MEIKQRVLEVMEEWEIGRLRSELYAYIMSDTDKQLAESYFDDIATEEEAENGQLYVGKFESLNFVIDHESLSFVGYEFEGKEILIEESQCEQSLFRCRVDKKTGEVTVNAAYSQDYDVMEDVTWYFDTEQLLADIKAEIDKDVDAVSNHGDWYVKYCQLCDEGYDCDEAIVMCSQDDEEEEEEE
jgi:hypothetical protein